jgi:diguanylate cyclase (GGDEF)-like protein/PAS domain S-box-containing protein
MEDCVKTASGSIIKCHNMFFRILGIIFVTEFIVMLSLWFIDMPSGILEFIMDSILLSVLSAPFLYLGVVRVVARRLHAEAMQTKAALAMELEAKAYAEKMAVKAYADNIVKSVPSGLVVISRDLNVFTVNPSFNKMFSTRSEDVTGRHIEDILPFADLKEAINDALASGNESQDLVLESSSEGNRFFRISISRIKPAEDSAESQVLLVIEDITERKRSEEKIIQLANYDNLTGLPNRRLLMNFINRTITLVGRRALYAAVLFIDLDRFKLINDTLGHSAGDELLKEVAERLKKCVRLSDIVGRLGGDEFIALLPDIEQFEDVIIICKRIYSIFEIPVKLGDHEVSVMTSIGISIYPTDGDDGDTLLRKADVAMYRAKSDGKSCYRFYSESMSHQGSDRLRLENRLRRAVDRGEMYINYQPQVDINTGKICGAEALLRWHDGEHGMISPKEFIPVAEESGLIIPIGEWILRTACTQAKSWQDKGLNCVKLTVNISLRQFIQKDFVHMVGRILKETGLDASYLEIELTESIIMDNAEAVVKILGELKETGVRLAIDDFGTGYSSLIYLKLMPIDIIKIDQSFVRDMAVNVNDAAICDAIIRLAKSLNLEVIAEGVETMEQIELLKRLDCCNIQGYVVSKPLKAEDFEVFLGKDWLFTAAPSFIVRLS